MQFNHINLVVSNPEHSAQFYQKYLVPKGECVWLGNSLHLRDMTDIDLVFQQGDPVIAAGSHHGFLSQDSASIDQLLDSLKTESVQVTDDCTEEGFRSIKFLDPDGYEIEIYWEANWPQD